MLNKTIYIIYALVISIIITLSYNLDKKRIERKIEKTKIEFLDYNVNKLFKSKHIYKIVSDEYGTKIYSGSGVDILPNQYIKFVSNNDTIILTGIIKIK